MNFYDIPNADFVAVLTSDKCFSAVAAMVFNSLEMRMLKRNVVRGCANSDRMLPLAALMHRLFQKKRIYLLRIRHCWTNNNNAFCNP
jgi:hypothetical protein